MGRLEVGYTARGNTESSQYCIKERRGYYNMEPAYQKHIQLLSTRLETIFSVCLRTSSNEARKHPALAKFHGFLGLHELLQDADATSPRPREGAVLGKLVSPAAGQHAAITVTTVRLATENISDRNIRDTINRIQTTRNTGHLNYRIIAWQNVSTGIAVKWNDLVNYGK